MDDQLAGLAVKLTEAAVKNTAGSIATKISSVKAQKDAQKTIQVLDEMVNDLLADKNEVIRIAQAYEQELISQKISDKDIEYITNTIVPLVEKFINEIEDEKERAKSQKYLDTIKAVLSKETITVMQLVGFNFKKAIGEPLTILLQQSILSKAPSNDDEIKKLNLKNSNLSIDLALNKDAYERFLQLTGRA